MSLREFSNVSWKTRKRVGRKKKWKNVKERGGKKNIRETKISNIEKWWEWTLVDPKRGVIMQAKVTHSCYCIPENPAKWHKLINLCSVLS